LENTLCNDTVFFCTIIQFFKINDYILKIDIISRLFFYSYTSQYTGSQVEWEIGQAKIDGQTSNYFANLSGQNPTRAKNRKIARP